MEGKNNHKAVAFITREGIHFFSTATKNVTSINFDQKVVRDLDVIDSRGVEIQVQKFIDQNKLTPSLIIFVFSEAATFFLDVSVADISKIDAIKEDFVNTVPFETLLTKSYNTKNGIRVVSINERLFREIANGFESRGFLSVGVIPTFVLGDKGAALVQLDSVSGTSMINQFNSLKEQSFFGAHSIEKAEEESEGMKKPVVEKSFKITPKVIGLGFVFIVLIIVFIVLLVNQSNAS